MYQSKEETCIYYVEDFEDYARARGFTVERAKHLAREGKRHISKAITLDEYLKWIDPKIMRMEVSYDRAWVSRIEAARSTHIHIGAVDPEMKEMLFACCRSSWDKFKKETKLDPAWTLELVLGMDTAAICAVENCRNGIVSALEAK